MVDIIKDIETTGSWNDMRSALGNLLGLDHPVSSAVLARAREDDKFASHLFISRFDLDLLNLFLNDKRNIEYELYQIPENHSNMQLAKKATKALLEWGKTGFHTVSKEIYEQRLNSCNTCEFIRNPPHQLAYKVKLKSESDPRICGACGCGISRKARLATETCPVQDPSKKGFNLWNEPVRS
ncbi:hypothetical protein [Sphingobacterium sp. UME9]|jgi:hypothetical protein|uniref:hypothetical protein n=1 Tax=Sphingobacterium sp. UME9 TaxID=1862316 RepID=UPI0015FF97D1|nr:hypothetical protein [Sphingobacterium sp. UME9]MBB1642971.1 hypothetical protein [Sphingobacterium sp. UME9]